MKSCDHNIGSFPPPPHLQMFIIEVSVRCEVGGGEVAITSVLSFCVNETLKTHFCVTQQLNQKKICNVADSEPYTSKEQNSYISTLKKNLSTENFHFILWRMQTHITLFCSTQKVCKTCYEFFNKSFENWIYLSCFFKFLKNVCDFLR